jgi:hypothetical protein
MLSKPFQVALVTVLLAVMAFLAGGAALRESLTVDEVAHLGAGVSYLQKFDMRMNQEHPPLPKILAAIPLVIRGVRADYSDVSWTFSERLFGNMMGEWPWGHSLALRWNDPYATVAWARLPMLLLTLLMGLCVYRYAARFGGPWGGLLCLAAYVSTPAFLVFGPLILTDIPVTLFSLLTLWSFAEMWRAPSRHTMIVFGLFFAAALLSKFSAGLLLLGFFGFRLSLRIAPLAGTPLEKAELRVWRKLRGRFMWKGIFVAALTVYAVCLAFSWNQPTDLLQALGHNPASLGLRRLLLPLWDYFGGTFFVLAGSTRPTFILGHAYTHGVWFYFPVLFLLKSTLAFLLMLVLSAIVGLVARRKLAPNSIIPQARALQWRAVWVFLLVFTFACILSPMSISIRHFTMPILLLILMMAPVPRALLLLREKFRAATAITAGAFALLAVISIVTMIRTYPFLMPFVNHLGLGRPAYTLVNDSNLDWNQALPEAARFVRERGLSHALLDEYGFTDPQVYVPGAEFWNCQKPAPTDAGQWAIVSASMILDGHNCGWLMHYDPISIAGGSMFAIQLPSVIPAVGDPAGPPPPSEYRNFGGAPMDVQVIFLKVVRDPSLLQPTMEEMMARYREEQAKRKAERDAKRKYQ